MKLSKITESAIEIAKKAGKLILEEGTQKLEISEKGKNDLVTNVDKASEKLITEEIKKAYPKHHVLGEETYLGEEAAKESFQNAEYIWIVDPIDGTTNFIQQIPFYAVSIGVFKTKLVKTSDNYQYLSGELVSGVVFAPKLNELFYAEKGKGAYLNDKPIHVSNIEKTGDAITVTGFPPQGKEYNLPYFQTMVLGARSVRRLGSASIDLAYVAAGRMDCFWEFGLKPWDIAAGALLIEEAGGHVTDSNGNPLDLFGRDILATNSHLHPKILEIFSKV